MVDPKVACPPMPGTGDAGASRPEVLLSFDVEEHFRIEAAAGLALDPALKDHCRQRLEPMTYWLLERLQERRLEATFFVVGRIARRFPSLVRAIHGAGHEVASHSWEHRRIHDLSPDEFREDVRRGVDSLEQVIGDAVRGYRAPTFSIVRRTAWAIDILAELGLLYDSSIYPVLHDRYGVPDAPREPFLAEGRTGSLLEIPPATLRVLGRKLPIGGGGYFRLFPLPLMLHAIGQIGRDCDPPVAMLYFHPWEFDPEQAHLPMRPLRRFRTYVGIGRTRARLEALLAKFRFVRAVDVAARLSAHGERLRRFRVSAP